jgi:hypothetical protein
MIASGLSTHAPMPTGLLDVQTPAELQRQMFKGWGGWRKHRQIIRHPSSEQRVDVGRGDFRDPHEDDQECQRQNEKERPDDAMSKAVPDSIANQYPSVIEPPHSLAFPKNT